MKKTALLIITLDTKAEEALFLKKSLERQGLNVLMMDVGVFASSSAVGDITRQEVAAAAGEEIERLIQTKDKGTAIKTMMMGATALTESLYRQGKIQAVLSIGGVQGTIIGTSAMKPLPLGVPKIMLSTVASGRRTFEAYVGTNDMTLMHSVVDFFGLNAILRQVLSNAAGALAGMVKLDKVPTGKKQKVAITIYGTTTPAGRLIVSLLEKAGYEVVAFHPNGTGGMAMERMIRDGNFSGVIDLTTHELADELAGGDHACGPHRLEAASDMGIPQIVVPGSLDYIVKGRFEALTPSFKRRTTMMHNPEMTFVKTSVKEMAELGRIIAHKLNRSEGSTIVMIPIKGFSYPNDRGRPLYNPGGCRAFTEALKEEIKSAIPVHEFPYHINDEAFGREVLREFKKLMEKNIKQYKKSERRGKCCSRERSLT
jgi:uncharacterized protein (UPF0261 family)